MVFLVIFPLTELIVHESQVSQGIDVSRVLVQDIAEERQGFPVIFEVEGDEALQVADGRVVRWAVVEILSLLSEDPCLSPEGLLICHAGVQLRPGEMAAQGVHGLVD